MESLRKRITDSARINRMLLNVWPCIQGGGGRVTHLAQDFTRLTVRLPLTWRTRNIVGTIFGGSMYASTDPFFMLMLMRIMGEQYVVWDKGCTIRFKRPATQTLYADFEVSPERLAELRDKLAEGEAEVTWTVQYKDAEGVVYAEFDKVLYVAEKAFYRAKLARRSARAETTKATRSVA
jgi:acyl-coenzyme A thioesterase PaaI-like protein